MPKKKKPNTEVEQLAIWLTAACGPDDDLFTLLRAIAQRASVMAADTYSPISDDAVTDGVEPADDYGVRAVIAKFTATCDEHRRIMKEDGVE